MSSFSIGYTAQPQNGGASVIYEITFRQFSAEEVMRTYQPTVNFQRSVSGANLLAGPAEISKYIWAVSGVTDKTIALQLDEMYRAWNLDRSKGIAAAVAVDDDTWGDIGTRSAVFSTPPSYTYSSDFFVIAAFGLTEV